MRRDNLQGLQYFCAFLIKYTLDIEKTPCFNCYICGIIMKKVNYESSWRFTECDS